MRARRYYFIEWHFFSYAGSGSSAPSAVSASSALSAASALSALSACSAPLRDRSRLDGPGPAVVRRNERLPPSERPRPSLARDSGCALSRRRNHRHPHGAPKQKPALGSGPAQRLATE